MLLEALMAIAIGQDANYDGDPPPLEPGSALPFEDQATYVDDDNPPEPDPEYTVRRGTPLVSTPAGGGRVTVRLTGSARITVTILGRSRTAILGPGTTYSGFDGNGNGIPDDLDRPQIDIGPI